LKTTCVISICAV